MMERELKSLELFNAHQEDSRKRTDGLAKAVFLISGGALSLSVSLFTGDRAKAVPPDLVDVLRGAWIALFVSVAAYVLVISLMLIRDYRIGENWRKSLNGKLASEGIDDPGVLEFLMWACGTIGILSLLFGLASLVCVANGIIGG